MRVLGKHVLSTVRSGVYQYAKVESISGGKATVRLGATGKGSRITNLFISGLIRVGGLVIVDYTVDRPYVRPVQQDAETALQLNEAFIPLESLGSEDEEEVV